jgi:hypothetical protein
MVDGQNFRMVCPLQLPLSEDLINAIRIGHEIYPLAEDSMLRVLLGRPERIAEQAEYDALLLEARASMAANEIEELSSEIEVRLGINDIFPVEPQRHLIVGAATAASSNPDENRENPQEISELRKISPCAKK